MLTETEESTLATLLMQEQREQVSPKMERFWEPWRIKIAEGGRGAGAKSRGAYSVAVQRAQYEELRILCLREIQISLSESSHRLVSQTVKFLGYEGWDPTRDVIRSPSGSTFHFRGMKDLRASSQIKSFEDADIAIFDEASRATMESLDILVPTIRKPGSELWFMLNREAEIDPVIARFPVERGDVLFLHMEPGKIDNPWWTDELQKEMEEDYKRNPDLAEHIWKGLPRKQGDYAVMSRVAIRAAMEREIKAVGATEIGIDVARFGDDATVMYKRKGLKTIDKREFNGQDTQKTAKVAWDLAGHSSEIAIKVDDTGVGGGVTDRLRELGAYVVAVNFGGKAKDEDKYTSSADEMWFEFPVDEADIPNDSALMTELSGRLYDYDSKGRRKIEPKKEFKKRFGKSPDHADALLLTYFNPNRSSYLFSGDEDESRMVTAASLGL